MRHVGEPTALVVVDVQGTFADDFPGAGLPVPGAGETLRELEAGSVMVAGAAEAERLLAAGDERSAY